MSVLKFPISAAREHEVQLENKIISTMMRRYKSIRKKAFKKFIITFAVSFYLGMFVGAGMVYLLVMR